MPGASRRQHGALGDEAAARRLANPRGRRREREGVHAQAPRRVVRPRGRHQLRREVELPDADVRVRADGGHERALDLGARGVGGVHNAGVGVPALAGEVEGAGGVGAELGAEAGEVLDGGGALGAHNLRVEGFLAGERLRGTKEEGKERVVGGECGERGAGRTSTAGRLHK